MDLKPSLCLSPIFSSLPFNKTPHSDLCAWCILSFTSPMVIIHSGTCQGPNSRRIIATLIAQGLPLVSTAKALEGWLNLT